MMTSLKQTLQLLDAPNRIRRLRTIYQTYRTVEYSVEQLLCLSTLTAAAADDNVSRVSGSLGLDRVL